MGRVLALGGLAGWPPRSHPSTGGCLKNLPELGLTFASKRRRIGGGQHGAMRDHYTLCRCGGSHSMPFCDGTHASIGFRDDPPDDRAEAATDANDIVMASFSRSLTDGDFATTFYDTLFETEASLRELFANTDFEVQKPLLRHAVEVMIRFGAGDEGARAEIERLAERHARDDLNISPNGLYGVARRAVRHPPAP